MNFYSDPHFYPFEAFFGAWNPNGLPVFHPPATEHPTEHPAAAAHVSTRHYVLMSTVFSPERGKPKSLIHTNDESNGNTNNRNSTNDSNLSALIFRGYILDPPLHSLSESEDLLDYWGNSSSREHNGVFSAVRIKNNGTLLELVTDAFGIGCLYYRRAGSTIMFSSSPRFLQLKEDKPDLVAWRSLIQTLFICGDRTLSRDISRVSPGTVLRFEQDKTITDQWFDFSGLPDGTGRVDSLAVEGVEASFTRAMDRCLKLGMQDVLLPLSSGYDSRRILGYFLNNGIPFHSVTVSRLTPEGVDMDGMVAKKLAAEWAFSHEYLPAPDLSESLEYEKIRRVCLSHESPMHAWFLPAWKHPAQPTLWFDGLCGDTLGHSGLKISGIGSGGPATLKALSEKLFTRIYDSVLHPSYWPRVEDVRIAFMEYLKYLPAGNNFVDIAMILHRARRAISISSQQFSKPGMVVVYPYLDIDYVKNVLMLSPYDRFDNSLQRSCLSQFHPKLLAFYDKEKSRMPGGAVQSRKDSHCLSAKEILELMKMVRLKRKIQLVNLKYGYSGSDRPLWWLKPLLEMIDWKMDKPTFLEIPK